MNRLLRQFQQSIVILAQLDRDLSLTVIGVILFFSIAVGVATNALYDLLKAWTWFLLLLPAILIVGVGLWGYFRNYRAPVPSPFVGEMPTKREGLVVMLSTFRSFGNPSSENSEEQKEWTFPDLHRALATNPVNWEVVRQRIERSNLQPTLEAIRHHQTEGKLKQLWLISTIDLINEFGRVTQEGSCHLAPLFARVLKEGYGFEIEVNWQEEKLQVPTYDVKRVFEAVEYVFTIAIPTVQMKPNQAIVDITGGRITQTVGAVLACAPNGWAMQYTSTDHDPAIHGNKRHLMPLTIEVDVQSLLRQALAATQNLLDKSR